ncbi:AAA family ATPase [Polyangium sp. y55x31]|uniref:NACHT and WD repeat domain-containing protein n=1 Tax=Polyangium sp. y55x31 TaxID=3042688 RepID=UPI002482DD66|nr:AAA family ATPase [Polyangium sp. y55x31]MDI1480392.1 AAA family ATPase [Polyangium sp. y55x31]
MRREVIDFEDELARHERLFGREDVLEALLRRLQAVPRGWVLLLGSPGVGKSAVLAHILNKLPEATPHHFIRRCIEGWDRPEVVVQNLCAQIERRYGEQIDPDLPEERRLGELLQRVSKKHILTGKDRLILVIDGLDEAAVDGAGENLLFRFFPQRLPGGVVVLCASRPMYRLPDWMKQGCVVPIDLDDQQWLSSNESAARAFWEYHASRFDPPLDDAFVEEAVRRGGGNLLHAIRWRDWLEAQPASLRTAESIPEGLSDLLEQIWDHIDRLPSETRALVVKGLGLLCAAREALPIALFRELCGEGEAFLRAVRPFLRSEHAHWDRNQPAYRLFHTSFRDFIVERIGDLQICAHHAGLADSIAAWPPDERYETRRAYAIRHALAHRLAAGDRLGAKSLCCDVSYLEAKCRELGIIAVERDIHAVLEAIGNEAALDLIPVLAAVRAEVLQLWRGDPPASLPGLLYNRLRCTGWSTARIARTLHFPRGLPPLRLLHGVCLGPTRLRTLLGHDKAIVACVVTPDGNHVLSASVDRTLRLWALGTGECIAELKGHDDELTSCAITPDGKVAISTSTDGTARLWDLEGCRPIATLDNDGRWATSCTVSPDGERFVVGSDDGTITIWDRATCARRAQLAGHEDYVTACVVTASGMIVSASRDYTVRVWDPVSWESIHTLRHPDVGPRRQPGEKDERWWLTALVLLPGGHRVLAAAGDGSIMLWDLASGRCEQHFGAGLGRVDACTLVHQGQHLLCGMADGTIAVWDVVAARRVMRIEAHEGAVATCTAAPDGRRLISASNDRSIKIWELGLPESLVARNGHEAPVTECAIAPDGRIAVSASEDGTFKIWDIATGACCATLEGHADLVTVCAISPDGHSVRSFTKNERVRQWNLHHGAQWIESTAIVSMEDLGRWSSVSLRSRQALFERTPRFGNALTPDGQHVVLARQDGKLELRHAHNRTLIRELLGHSQRVLDCTASVDGTRVISASEDATVRVFDLETGQCLGVLHGTSSFRCVAVANGHICAGDQEGNVWLIVDETRARELRASARSPSTESVVRLGEKLAGMYPDMEDARLLATKHLDICRVELSGSPARFWPKMLLEACNQGRLGAVMRDVRARCPENDELATLIDEVDRGAVAWR